MLWTTRANEGSGVRPGHDLKDGRDVTGTLRGPWFGPCLCLGRVVGEQPELK